MPQNNTTDPSVLRAIRREAIVQACHKSFYFFCKTLMPGFYNDSREYQRTLCHMLQDFGDGDDDADVLVINMPPRHGKSLTVGLYVAWRLGLDREMQIMTASYNEQLSGNLSQSVRDRISTKKYNDEIIVYSDIFPDTKLHYGDRSKKEWSVEGGMHNYMATSPGSSATGFGANLIIVDDIVKNSMDAHNKQTLEAQWDWFRDTMVSRLEHGGKIAMVMTRWATDDLAGKALSYMPTVGYKVKHINMKAYDEASDTMLCDEILSRSDYNKKVGITSDDIIKANYQQEPIDIKGRLYTDIRTYEHTSKYRKIWAYVDPADTGNDYLAAIVWGQTVDGTAEVLDVMHTQEPMTTTEIELPKMLARNNVNETLIESNNGGRGFARMVQRGCPTTTVKIFAQRKNKDARIYSNSAAVQRLVAFPSDWKLRWHSFYSAITEYQAEGKNTHDDASDALTGVVETLQNKIRTQSQTTEKYQAFAGMLGSL